MTETTVHNPDQYMVDLRQILSQGKKRIGLLIGAGAPVSIRVSADGSPADSLIPDVAGLTKAVIDGLEESDNTVIQALSSELGDNPNIESILTRVRRLSQAIGKETVHDLDGDGYDALAKRVCEKIGAIVQPELPKGSNSYTQLVSWIGGTHRNHPVEIFTPNYDLLFEEAFERAGLPYFDGFTGAHKPFFDAASISEDALPNRWSRLWKIHGSLGWEISDESIIRTGKRDATGLIYPEHLKYDQIARQPYSALFERLRKFLMTPDSLLLCVGFSFSDPHITSVLDEALAANAHTAVLAFQFGHLDDSPRALELADKRANLSVYARDDAVISGIRGKWRPGQLPSEEWGDIRKTYWKHETVEDGRGFLLGDFAKLSKFFALAQAVEFTAEETGSIDLDERDNGGSAKEVERNAQVGGNK